jgi:hypothetical protein
MSRSERDKKRDIEGGSGTSHFVPLSEGAGHDAGQSADGTAPPDPQRNCEISDLRDSGTTAGQPRICPTTPQRDICPRLYKRRGECPGVPVAAGKTAVPIADVVIGWLEDSTPLKKLMKSNRRVIINRKRRP